MVPLFVEKTNRQSVSCYKEVNKDEGFPEKETEKVNRGR